MSFFETHTAYYSRERRDGGAVIWVPPDAEMDETAEALASRSADSNFRPIGNP